MTRYKTLQQERMTRCKTAERSGWPASSLQRIYRSKFFSTRSTTHFFLLFLLHRLDEPIRNCLVPGLIVVRLIVPPRKILFGGAAAFSFPSVTFWPSLSLSFADPLIGFFCSALHSRGWRRFLAFGSRKPNITRPKKTDGPLQDRNGADGPLQVIARKRSGWPASRHCTTKRSNPPGGVAFGCPGRRCWGAEAVAYL